MRFFCILFLAGVVLSCGKEETPSTKLSGKDFGVLWPLTVDEGTVECIDGLVIFKHGNDIYGVNPEARNKDVLKEKGWKDVMEIWKKDPVFPDLRLNIGPVEDAGQALCKKKK